MATTSPDNIWTPDSGDDYALTVDLAAMADSVQDALNTAKNYRVGPDAARLSLSGADLFPGLIWYSSDTGITWGYDGSSWTVSSPSSAHLSSGVVTSQSVIAIDGLTGFNEYEITLDLPSSSADNELSARLRSGGVANTASSYDWQYNLSVTTTSVSQSGTSQTSWTTSGGTRVDKLFVLRLSGLNQSTRTIGFGTLSSWSSANVPMFVNNSFRHRVSSPFNGIEFTTSSGTVTGNYSVRGIV